MTLPNNIENATHEDINVLLNYVARSLPHYTRAAGDTDTQCVRLLNQVLVHQQPGKPAGLYADNMLTELCCPGVYCSYRFTPDVVIHRYAYCPSCGQRIDWDLCDAAELAAYTDSLMKGGI